MESTCALEAARNTRVYNTHTGMPAAVASIAASVKPWHFQVALAITQTLFVVGSVCPGTGCAERQQQHPHTSTPP